MARLARPARAGLLVAVTVVVVLAVAACGGSADHRVSEHTRSGEPVSPSTAVADGTVTLVQTTFPDSLDPQVGQSAQSAEATWVTDTGLVSVAHRSGSAGTALIPGLARSLPRVSDGGRTYTVRLRSGLSFSDGRPVRALAFLQTLERAVVLWAGAPSLLDRTVVGATAFADGQSRTISGVSVDDRTGRVVIHLTAPDGGFDAVLAMPALGLVAVGSRPFDVDPRDPPPGCGPYEIVRVVPGRSYVLARNPRWKPLPGIPAGSVNVAVKVSPDATDDADAVLNDTADLLDWTVLPSPGVISQLRSEAPGRFALVDTGAETDYLFLNETAPPFTSPYAREAVAEALDRDRLARLGGDLIAPGCDLLAPTAGGPVHDTGCTRGAAGHADLSQARQLVRRSGETGESVLVWTPRRSPERQWMAYYVRVLDAIGFHADLVPLALDDDASAIARPASNLQTGLGTLAGRVSDPIALDGPLLTGNENLDEVHDSGLDRAVTRLRLAAPTDTAPAQALDADVAARSDVIVLGYARFAFLASERMDDAAIVVSPVYGWDFTSLRLR